MTHTCHAPGCTRQVPPKMYACLAHWRALPKKIQDAIWREYSPGQEVYKDPSLRYLAVQRLACAYLVFKPDSEAAVLEAIPYIAQATRYAKKAVEAGLGDPLEGLVPKEWPIYEPTVKAKLRVVR